jgi:hypothetical protein
MNRRPNLTIDTQAAAASRKQRTNVQQQQQPQAAQNLNGQTNNVGHQQQYYNSSRPGYRTGETFDDYYVTEDDNYHYYDDDDDHYHTEQNFSDEDDHGRMNGQQNIEDDEAFDSGEESGLSTPRTPDENISFNHVYALYRFDATQEGQLSVRRDTPLQLLDDSNVYWWLVRIEGQDAVGYIPAENIETPYERLSRLNRSRNVKLLLPNEEDMQESSAGARKQGNTQSNKKRVFFNTQQLAQVTHFEREEEDDDDESEYGSEYSTSDNDIDDSNSQQQDEDNSDSIGRRRSDWGRGRSPRNSDDSLREQMAAHGGIYDAHHDDEHVSSPLSWTESELESNTSMDPYNDYVDVLSPQMAEYPSACVLRVFPADIPYAPPYKNVVVTDKTTAVAMVRQAIRRFKFEDTNHQNYYLSIVTNNSGDYRLNDDDHPIAVLQLLRAQSLVNVKRFSGTRASTASISNIISQLGLNETDVHDHTGHDDVFRFYLHYQPMTPTTSSSLSGAGRSLMEAIFVKIVVYALNDGNRQYITLATDKEPSREIVDVVGVDGYTTTLDMANLARKQLSIRDTGEFQVLLHYNGQEVDVAPETVVAEAIQGQEDTAFFIIKGGPGAFAYQFPKSSRPSSPTSQHLQTVPRIMVNGAGISSSSESSRRSSAHISQEPPPVAPKSERRMSDANKRTSLQEKRTSLRGKRTSQTNLKRESVRDSMNGGVDMFDFYDQYDDDYDDYDDDTFNYDRSMELSDDELTSNDNTSTLVSQQQQPTESTSTSSRVDSWTLDRAAPTSSYARPPVMEEPRSKSADDAAYHRASDMAESIVRPASEGTVGSGRPITPPTSQSPSASIHTGGRVTPPAAAAVTVPVHTSSPVPSEEKNVRTASPVAQPSEERRDSNASSEVARPVASPPPTSPRSPPTTTSPPPNNADSNARVVRRPPPLSQMSRRPNATSVVQNVLAGIAPPSTPPPPSVLKSARRTSNGPTSPPMLGSAPTSPPLSATSTGSLQGHRTSSSLDHSLMARLQSGTPPITNAPPTSSGSPVMFARNAHTPLANQYINAAIAASDTDRADSADSYRSSTRTVSTARTTPATGSPVNLIDTNLGDGRYQLAGMGLFETGGFSDLLRLTHPATADAEDCEIAENSSRRVANLFGESAAALDHLEQELYRMMQNLVNVF